MVRGDLDLEAAVHHGRVSLEDYLGGILRLERGDLAAKAVRHRERPLGMEARHHEVSRDGPVGGRGRDVEQPRPEFPQIPDRDTLRRAHQPRATAHVARLARPALERLPSALARHLENAEVGDRDRGRSGLVALERPAELGLDLRAVLGRLHVDEVHHDKPADVPEPELPSDLARGLEVRQANHRRAASSPARAAGVHVDHCHGLGLLDDDRPAVRERDAAVDQRLHQLLDAEAREDGLVALVELARLAHGRRVLVDETLRALVGVACVEPDFVGARDQVVAERANGEIGLLVEEGRRGDGAREFADPIPPRQEVVGVLPEFARVGGARLGADHEAEVLGRL